jgi:UDP-N-acetylmuramate dehydrogenase
VASAVEQLRQAFPQGVEEGASLAPHTAARLGGPAEVLLTVRSGDELRRAVELIWSLDLPLRVLGGGSNVLVADAGVKGVVVLNQAKAVRFEDPGVWAESGAFFGTVARRCVEKGLAGLEWAATVPGTIGGAVVGNAGAHGGEVADVLVSAEVLHRDGAASEQPAAGSSPGWEGPGRSETWPAERLEFAYRQSWLKRNPGRAVVLSAAFRLGPGDPQALKARVAELTDYRKRTQPTGASWGSMFKNPPGDHAGRLIDAAGLKGERRGEAEISTLHANFFLNRGGATAADVWELLGLARRRVKEQFGVELELEIELVGDWGDTP